MTLKNIWILIKAAASSWVDDYAQSMGAALAYYTMFSIAPLLLIVISIAGLIFGVEASRGEIIGQLQGLTGQHGAEAVQGLLESVSKPAKSVTATLVGGILLLIGATTVFAELQDALDRIWRAPKRHKSGIWSLLRARLLSFGMIMGIGFLLMVSLVVSAALAALGKLWGPLFADWEILANVINFLISFAFTTTLFAMIYKIMPRVKVDWADVWIGAAVTALLFTIGKFLIGLYIGKSGLDFRIRCRRFAGRRAGVGVLLRPDISDGCGIYLGLCAYIRIAQRAAGARRCARRSQPDGKNAA